MATDDGTNPLDALQNALASNDMRTIEGALLSLNTKELDALRVRLSEQEVERLFRSVRKRNRSTQRGRVVVIHGIMGGQLDAVKGKDSDRVWLKIPRIILGRIANFRLNPDGTQADPKYAVKVRGMFPEYLPLLTELGEQWNVLPFAFDWRLNIDEAVKDLARQITEWAKGEPAHIVAHSMGGLVARRFIQQFPALWRSMQDPTNSGRGGRLVQMGTPNKGSYAIPLILSGKEKTVKKLEMVDLQHNMKELLEIINTFPGSYQMMPSPDVDAGDDHLKLYDIDTWKGLPVLKQHLDLGRDFQTALTTVTDPERLVYVAGYDQETPCKIKIDDAGNFSYQTTMDGDGRVPHEFGLLEGVRTFYVPEVHGTLPRNESVLAAIHELMIDGTTGALEVQMPLNRALKRSGPAKWKQPDEIEMPVEEEWSLLTKPFVRGTSGRRGVVPASTPEEEALLEATLLSEYIGSPQGVTRGGTGPRTPDAPAKSKVPARKHALPALKVQVVWGDITRVDADVYVAGHYERVAPIGAELALDRVVSGITKDKNREPLLTALTRRGILSGQLGHVQFFPWADNPKRSVAIAGMGYPGSFDGPELRHLARSLTYAVGALPNAQKVCTVLIGSGAGNELDVQGAVKGLILGILEASASMPLTSHVGTVCIVERDYGRANEILRALKALELPSSLTGENGTSTAPNVSLQIDPVLFDGGDGEFGTPQCLSLALQSTIEASRAMATPQQQNAIKVLLDMIPEVSKFRTRTIERIKATASAEDEGDFIARADRWNLRIGRDDNMPSERQPARISFVHDGTFVQVAAITDTAVVPQRQLAFDLSLLDETIERMTDPYAVDVPELADLLARLVVPRDFRKLLDREKAIVFEVDRSLARVHWEMLSTDVSGERANAQSIALTRQVSRQLRTQFSPAPSSDYRAPGPLRALVVGDPGDPAEGHNLPGAQEEAFAVDKILREKGVQVTLMVGAPGDRRSGRLKNVPAASRLDVLKELMRGGYDLLHYAGHGDFDRQRPDTAGWIFKGGLITSRELEQMDLAPRLVVANACLSGLTAQAANRERESEVLPSLADQFFRRGVRNYIGTAWEVSDAGAVEFARCLYQAIIPDITSGNKKHHRGATFGDGVLKARQELFRQSMKYDALWAAYQHYGDPNQDLNVAQLPGGAGTDDDADDAENEAAEDSQRSASAQEKGAKAGAARPATKRTAKKAAVKKAKSAGGASKTSARKGGRKSR